MSYHNDTIPRGTYGFISKIREEFAELEDAHNQENKIMVGCELSDLYGAIRGYAEKHGFTMRDLEKMADVTQRVFESGYRKARE